MGELATGLIFLAAAVVAVPIFKGLKLGAILGYLCAGVLIGPSVFNLINDPDTILHVAELGVVLLLFVIGLELEPATLWRMRRSILLAGGGQLLLTAMVIGGLLLGVLAYSLAASVVVALAVALSSTAFAIQLMAEFRLLNTDEGEKGFSILLFQDLAVIPILLLVDTLAPASQGQSPAWYITLSAIAVLLVVGRYLINPLLRFVSRYGSTEVMTAATLLIVMATAGGMHLAGLSMGMGAFVAGMLLANSSFRHQLEIEIEPFKGLLLGLFFIAIGMNLDLSLLGREPAQMFALSLALVLIKGLIIVGLFRLFKVRGKDAMRTGLMLSQGGEFAFVVMTHAVASGLLANDLAARVNLVVGLSMALTSPLLIVFNLWAGRAQRPANYDSERSEATPQVIIAGFGRFGQMAARILSANGVGFTALDIDAEHIEFVQRFGNKVFYGDASRIELLEKAGIEHARVLLVAVDDEEAALNIARQVRRQCPDIRIVARAHNRMSVAAFKKLGVEVAVREMFASGLVAANEVLKAYGYSDAQAESMVSLFKQHDEKVLARSLEKELALPELIEQAQLDRAELASLFRQDTQDIVPNKH